MSGSLSAGTFITMMNDGQISGLASRHIGVNSRGPAKDRSKAGCSTHNSVYVCVLASRIVSTELVEVEIASSIHLLRRRPSADALTGPSLSVQVRRFFLFFFKKEKRRRHRACILSLVYTDGHGRLVGHCLTEIAPTPRLAYSPFALRGSLLCKMREIPLT